LAGHWLCGVLSEIADICRPLSRLKRVTVRSMMLLLPADEDAVVTGALDGDAEDTPEVAVHGQPAVGRILACARSSGSAARSGRRTASCAH
jgi:hypothetical protein